MQDQLEQRLNELKAEFQAGQKMLVELEAKQANLQQTLLRISGAMQVLEELLNGTSADAPYPSAMAWRAKDKNFRGYGDLTLGDPSPCAASRPGIGQTPKGNGGGEVSLLVQLVGIPQRFELPPRCISMSRTELCLTRSRRCSSHGAKSISERHRR